jgi:hypothetical protein
MTTESKPRPGFLLYVVGGFTGAVIGAVVPLLGDWIGALLEDASGNVFRAWEFAALQVAGITVPGGAIVGFLGAISKRWMFGLGVGAVVHALAFVALVTTGSSMQAAPATVKYWVLTVGIAAGAAAGASGGVLSRAPLKSEEGS